MSALTWNHGVVNTFWAEAPKLTSDALVEAFGLDVHEVALVEEVDDVQAHPLAHLSRVDSCNSSSIDSSNLAAKMSMWSSLMSSTANGCLVELDVGSQACSFLDRVVGLIHSTVHALIYTLLLAVVLDAVKLESIIPHG